MKKPKKTGGFTLIELLVVIAILGLLSTIVLVGVSDQRQKARDTKRLSEIRQVIIALEMFHHENNRYPGSIEGISDSGECIGDDVSCGASNAFEVTIRPFISGVPQDPTHNCTGGSCGGAGNYYYFYDPTNPACQPVIGFHLFENGGMGNRHGRRDTTVNDDVMDIANSEFVICLD